MKLRQAWLDTIFIVLIYSKMLYGYPFYVMFNAKSTVSTSSDGGVTWYHVSPKTNDCYKLWDVKCFSPRQCYAVNNALQEGCPSETGILTTYDGFSKVWTYKAPEKPDLKSLDCWNEHQCLVVGTHARTAIVLRTESAWSTIAPARIPSQSTNQLKSVSTMPYGRAVAVGNGVILRTTDYGKTWIRINHVVHVTSQTDFKQVSCFCDTCVIVGSGELLLHSTDSGYTWRKTAVPFGQLCNSYKCPAMVSEFSRVSCASSRFCAIVARSFHPTIPGGICWTFDKGYTWKCHLEPVYKDVANQHLSFYDIHCGAEGHCVATISDPPRQIASLTWKDRDTVVVKTVSNSQIFQIPVQEYLVSGTRPASDVYSVGAASRITYQHNYIIIYILVFSFISSILL